MYRPVAPEAIDRVFSALKRLAGETILPWHLDPETKQFYVIADGERHWITFNTGDAETQIVELITANLPLIIDTVEGKFVLIDQEWKCRTRNSDSSGSAPPATETSSIDGDSNPPEVTGSKEISEPPSLKRSRKPAKKSVRKVRSKRAKK